MYRESGAGVSNAAQQTAVVVLYEVGKIYRKFFVHDGKNNFV